MALPTLKMITMNELVDLRMQQHIAQEIYRQQIMQRIPDPFPAMLPIPMPHHVFLPPRPNLPGVEVTLQNDDLWKQFHQIGTEMIITKSGRRMFPSMRLSISGLDEDTNYCVLLEMVLIGDCRYKFSGSQWVAAGGAEPQSPQRMYLHPDSPAMGSHWQSQPILFNKVKLTNNTLDNSGHTVLASMHKYQPRIHVIRTGDLSQIPWAPQQAFVFPETEFVAVTAYQNDRITKLKIDNNPFAKGFRETGQSRCKRKMSLSPTNETDNEEQSHSQSHSHPRRCDISPIKPLAIAGDNTLRPYYDDTIIIVDDETSSTHLKRIRPLEMTAYCSERNVERIQPPTACMATSSNSIKPPPQQQQQQLSIAGNEYGCKSEAATSVAFMHHFQQNMQTLLRPSLVDLACTYFTPTPPLCSSSQHIYSEPAQRENMLLANNILPSLQLPALPPPSSFLLPPSVSDELLRSSTMTETINKQQQQQQQQQQQNENQMINDELPPISVTAAVTLATSSHDCLINDSDHSSSDSSLPQDEATVIPTTTTATIVNINTTTTTTTITRTRPTTNLNQLMADDAFLQTSSSQQPLPSPPPPPYENTSPNRNRANDNNNNNHANNNSSNDCKKRGFSISAILGAGS